MKVKLADRFLNVYSGRFLILHLKVKRSSLLSSFTQGPQTAFFLFHFDLFMERSPKHGRSLIGIKYYIEAVIPGYKLVK